MSKSYDVVIVGAGPAGVSAALSCAKYGLSVLLLDSKARKDIGDKVCGEALSKRTALIVSNFHNISPPQEKEVNTNIHTMIIRTDDPLVNISLPAIGFMINRHIYGQRLLEEVLARGITLLDQTKVVRPIIKEKKVVGVVARINGKTDETFYAKIVIDCSGCRAVIRTNLPEDFAPLLYKGLTKEDYASCYREIIELENDHDLDGYIVLQYEKDIPEPGYIWFFGDGDKKLNCGTGFRKVGKNKDISVKEVYFNTLKKYYPSYKAIDSRGDVVPVQPPLWNAVAPGLIVAGDAAFHADPLTAEGHGPALLAGMIAGEVAAEAIKNNKFDTEQLWAYNVRVMEEFGADNTLYKILAEVLEQIGAEDLKFLLKRKVIQQSDLTTTGLGKKEPFYSLLLRAIRCFPRFHLLFYLKKTITASNKIKQLCREFPENAEEYVIWREKIKQVYDFVH
ncbi:MAG: geranylgeranyl reductase family protein [Candidatus Heimdallarchaeaceae archaeon]